MTKRIVLGLTDQQQEKLDKLVAKGIYQNRTEAIRDAIRKLIEGRR